MDRSPTAVDRPRPSSSAVDRSLPLLLCSREVLTPLSLLDASCTAKQQQLHSRVPSAMMQAKTQTKSQLLLEMVSPAHCNNLKRTEPTEHHEEEHWRNTENRPAKVLQPALVWQHWGASSPPPWREGDGGHYYRTVATVKAQPLLSPNASSLLTHHHFAFTPSACPPISLYLDPNDTHRHTSERLGVLSGRREGCLQFHAL